MKKKKSVSRNLIIILGFIGMLIIAVGCGQSSNGGIPSTEEQNSEESEGISESAENIEIVYPDQNKPIEFIIQYPAGGGTDLVYRAMEPVLERELGTDIIWKNFGEGGGIVGIQELVKADPDGYTVGVLSAGQTVVAQLFRDDLSYSLEDLRVGSSFGTLTYGLFIPGDAPYEHSFGGLVKYIKEHPGELSVPEIPANVSTIFYTWLQNEFDLEFQLVPVSSGSESAKMMLDGTADFAYGFGSTYGSLIESGDVELIASINDFRWEEFPDVPTIEELGHPDVFVSTVMGVAFPKGTPDNVIEKWNSVMEAVINDPEVLEKWDNLNQPVEFRTAEETEARLVELESVFKKMLEME